MAQKSLIRLDRINCSMTWESNIVEKGEFHWFSLKIYIYFKFFIPFLFNTLYYNFFKFWNFKAYRQLSSYNISPNINNNNFDKQLSWPNKYSLFKSLTKKSYYNILKFYFYTYNNNSFIFIIYIKVKDLLKFLNEVRVSNSVDNSLLNYKASNNSLNNKIKKYFTY